MPKPSGFDAAKERHEALIEDCESRMQASEDGMLQFLHEWHKTDSQGTIAKELGVSKPYINDLLRGRRQWPRRIRPKQRSGKR